MDFVLLHYYPKQNHKRNTRYYQTDAFWTLNIGVNTFAQRLLFARQQRGLTQKKLAKLCNISQSTIASYENGSRLHARNIIELANALHVTPKWLCYGEGTMYPTLQEESDTYSDTWPFTRVSPKELINLPAHKLQLIENILQVMLENWKDDVN